MNTARKQQHLTDEQATWKAFDPKTGEVLTQGSFDDCQRFLRTSKRHCVVRRIDAHKAQPSRRLIPSPG